MTQKAVAESRISRSTGQRRPNSKKSGALAFSVYPNDIDGGEMHERHTT